MSEVRFTDQHEWVRIEGDVATIGITKYAAEQLGDVVYVELPEIGRKVGTGGEAAVVIMWPTASTTSRGHLTSTQASGCAPWTAPHVAAQPAGWWPSSIRLPAPGF